MNTNDITRFAQERSVSAFLTLVEHASDREIEKLFAALEGLTRGSELAQTQIPAIRKSLARRLSDHPFNQAWPA